MDIKQITQVKSCAKCGNQLIYERREGVSFDDNMDKRMMKRNHFCIDCNSDCEVKWITLHHWTQSLRSGEHGVDEEFPLIRVCKKTGQRRFASPHTWDYHNLKSKLLDMIVEMNGGQVFEYDSKGRLVAKGAHNNDS
jgi:hypothetical protein